MGIELIPIYGITIPVIIRVGACDTKVALKDAKLERGEQPSVNLTIARSGIHSIFGDVELMHYDNTGKETMVGFVRGVAVYTPLQGRKMKITFNKATTPLSSGRLKVVYSFTSSGKKTILA